LSKLLVPGIFIFDIFKTN